MSTKQVSTSAGNSSGGRTSHRGFIATLVAVAATVLGPVTGSEWLSMLSYPGIVVASVVWPEGGHGGDGGVASGLGFLGVAWLSNAVIWWLVSYALLGLLQRKGARSAKLR